MEVIGIGTEIVECARIGRLIEQHGEAFLCRVYTQAEMSFCHGRPLSLPYFSAWWAGKIAIWRCLEIPAPRTPRWLEVEIASSPNRQVHVVLHGATKEMTNEAHIADVKLSTAQCRSYATGYAIALADRLPR